MSALSFPDLIRTVRWEGSPGDEGSGGGGGYAPAPSDEDDPPTLSKRLFLRGLADVVEGSSIAERFAVEDSGDASADSTAGAGPLPPRPTRRLLSSSERVVRSHLRYLTGFHRFRDGVVTKESLYEFLYYALVERRLRETYAVRVLKTVLSYLRSGGHRAVANLTAESRDFIERLDTPLGGISLRTFYQRVNAVTNETGDMATKRVLSEARARRALVFSDEEESTVLRHCVACLRDVVHKYWTGTADVGGAGTARDRQVTVDTGTTDVDTTPGRVRYERTIFEFSFAYLLGFLSGARIKSTILRLSRDEVASLLAGGEIELLSKGGVFVKVFLPADVLRNDAALYGNVSHVRSASVLYTGDDDTAVGTDAAFFTRTARRLELMLDRVYGALFGRKSRSKGVRWHSQRRRYLAAVSDKYGTATASESVGHRDVATTLAYINRSVHTRDVRRKASDAIGQRYADITAVGR